MPRFLTCLLVLLSTLSPLAAQPVEVGVVYDPAETLAERLTDYGQIQAVGARALLTAPVQDDRLLVQADSLGLALYQELPAWYLTGAQAEAQRAALDAALTDVLTRGRGHPSARTIGLARRPDTADPRVCRVLRDLAERARAERPGVRLYYVATFVEQDRCADVVDFVLLPRLDARNPGAMLARWQAAHPDTPAGLIVGWHVVPEAEGLRAADSPERAAAHLDTTLTRLLRTERAPRPASVFVYRWRDVGAPALDLAPVVGGAYGLLEGPYVRPAYDVVQGHFSGTRTVFALRGGEPRRQGRTDGLVLLTWGVVGLLGWTMRREPRVRQMAQRYFSARGFYRESVREARDALGLTTAVLTLVVALSTGVVGAVLIGLVRSGPAFGYLVATLSSGDGGMVAHLLERPVLLALALAGAVIVAQGVQALAYTLAVRRRYHLRPVQVLALAWWSRWFMIPLAFVALVLPTLPAAWVGRGLLLVAGLALLVEVWALFRTLVDLVALTRVPGYVALALALIHPFVLIAVVLALASFDYAGAYTFFLRLVEHGIG